MSRNRVCLVIGGGGFLGSHLTKLLLNHKDATGQYVYSLVRVLDRAEFKPENYGIDSKTLPTERLQTYVADILYPNQLKPAFVGVETVFHLASLVYVGLNRNPMLQKINVEGARNVVQMCIDCNVRSLVYTSSTDVVLCTEPRNNADETTCSYPTTYLNDYIRTKVEGEKLILAANGTGGLLTCALRPCHLYGPGDPHAIKTTIALVRRKGLPFRLGDGSAKFGIVYVDNIAQAHVLAADALRAQREQSPVAGSAYFIGEDNNINYLDFVEPYVRSKGLTLPTWHLPWKLLFLVACLIEVVHFFVSKIVPSFDPPIHRFTCYVIGKDFNFKSDKARRDFGYVPIVSKEEALKRTLKWLDTVDV